MNTKKSIFFLRVINKTEQQIKTVKCSYPTQLNAKYLGILKLFFQFSIHLFYLKDNCFTELCWFLPKLEAFLKQLVY